MKLDNIFEEHVVRMSFVQKLSFIAIGMPSKSDLGFCFLYLSHDFSDFSFASFNVVVINAFKFRVFSIFFAHLLSKSCGVNVPSYRNFEI